MQQCIDRGRAYAEEDINPLFAINHNFHNGLVLIVLFFEYDISCDPKMELAETYVVF